MCLSLTDHFTQVRRCYDSSLAPPFEQDSALVSQPAPASLVPLVTTRMFLSFAPHYTFGPRQHPPSWVLLEVTEKEVTKKEVARKDVAEKAVEEKDRSETQFWARAEALCTGSCCRVPSSQYC